MKKCAFLSISNTEGWFIDDDLVHGPLQILGWEVINIPWNKSVDWNDFDMVIIRSSWDYQDHLDQFLGVLDEIEKSDTILLNSLSTVKWNINKNYLFELEDKGIELVPTIKISNPERQDFERAFSYFKSNEIIIKPMIGANADDTYRLNQHEFIDYDKLESIFKGRECMIQTFMDNVIKEGEYSMMYFGGKLSHTILKTVGDGDYRVQEEHGGGVVIIEEPEEHLLETANKVMKSLDKITLYARVDLVRTSHNSFALMELELIEPCLYFRFNDNSAVIFAQCIEDNWQFKKAKSR